MANREANREQPGNQRQEFYPPARSTAELEALQGPLVLEALRASSDVAKTTSGDGVATSLAEERASQANKNADGCIGELLLRELYDL